MLCDRWVVPVVCEAATLISIVKKKIRKEKQYFFPTDKLTLYVAKKDGKLDGECLSDEDKANTRF
jgi:hypothetical protein